MHHLPCIIVTGRGFPDLATRALLQSLVVQLQLPCWALTDWNPHGLCLFLTYKVGSTNFGLESYCCPELEWLGVGSRDVDRLQRCGSTEDWLQDSFQAFSQRDAAVVEGLLKRPVVQRDPRLVQELNAMQDRKQKLEIESLYAGPEGSNFIVKFVRDGLIERRHACQELADAAARRGFHAQPLLIM